VRSYDATMIPRIKSIWYYITANCSDSVFFRLSGMFNSGLYFKQRMKDNRYIKTSRPIYRNTTVVFNKVQ